MRSLRVTLLSGRRLGVAMALSVIAVFVGPMPAASAHATLLFTTPAADGAVPTSPEVLQLVFDQPVVPSGSSLKISDTGGRAWPVEPVESGANGQSVTARVHARLPVGQYLVQWQVTARDGDAMLGEYRFAVGSSSGLALASGTTGGVSTTLALFRWILFAGLALALGGLVGHRLTSRRPSELRTPRPWMGLGVLLGVVASVGLALLFIGGGSIMEGLTGSSIDTLWSSTPGRLAALEVVAFLVAAALLFAKRKGLAGVVLLVVPMAEGVRAHPQAAEAGLGAVVTAVHLTAAAIWAGALFYVVRVGLTWRKQKQSATGLVASYARLTLWLFIIVVVTGSAAGLLLIPFGDLSSTLLHTAYGRWLLVKLVVVVVVAALALWARAHLRRRAVQRQPSRAAAVEVVALVIVLGISSLLTALAPPVRTDLELPFPPPPVGPVVAVGNRAGFIGVGVTASAGQLLVRLTTPDTDGGVALRDEQTYDLAGNISSRDNERTARLEFRGCGQGCFVAPFDWRPGTTTVTLRAEASSFPGGTTAVNVAWPPEPAPDRLKQVVQAMRKVRRFTLHEQVTSDTTQGLGIEHALALTGTEFLASEPYGSGIASSVTLVNKTAAETTLALVYPGEGTYVLLTVGRDGRIIRERLAAANHLVSRSFAYPEP